MIPYLVFISYFAGMWFMFICGMEFSEQKHITSKIFTSFILMILLYSLAVYGTIEIVQGRVL